MSSQARKPFVRFDTIFLKLIAWYASTPQSGHHSGGNGRSTVGDGPSNVPKDPAQVGVQKTENVRSTTGCGPDVENVTGWYPAPHVVVVTGVGCLDSRSEYALMYPFFFFLIYRVTNVWTWPMLLYPRHLPRENESSSKVSNTYKSTKTMIFIHILSVYDKFRWIPLAISLWIPSAILLEITQTIQKLPRIITKGTSNGIWERIADFQKNCGRNLKKNQFLRELPKEFSNEISLDVPKRISRSSINTIFKEIGQRISWSNCQINFPNKSTEEDMQTAIFLGNPLAVSSKICLVISSEIFYKSWIGN